MDTIASTAFDLELDSQNDPNNPFVKYAEKVFNISIPQPLILLLRKYSDSAELTHLPLPPHMCVSESGQHWPGQWLVAYSAPSYYLNQYCVIINWTFTNKLQWLFLFIYYQNTKLFIHENASKNRLRNGDCFAQGVMNFNISKLISWLFIEFELDYQWKICGKVWGQ